MSGRAKTPAVNKKRKECTKKREEENTNKKSNLCQTDKTTTKVGLKDNRMLHIIITKSIQCQPRDPNDPTTIKILLKDNKVLHVIQKKNN